MSSGKYYSETITLLQERASVRRFRPDPIDEELLQQILVAATRAPTSFNFQGYALIVTSDPGRRKHLAELVGKRFLEDAPVLVLICADTGRLWEFGARQGESVGREHDDLAVTAAIDASLVGMCIAISAESIGLGTVRSRNEIISQSGDLIT